MKKRILWIEDDYHAIQGLMRPLEKLGFRIDAATSAVSGYTKAQEWQNYDVIVVDLILQSSDDDGALPAEVKNWESEEDMGVGLLKWLLGSLRAECPVIILSVVPDPISRYRLEGLEIRGHLPKRALLPKRVKEEILQLVGVTEEELLEASTPRQT